MYNYVNVSLFNYFDSICFFFVWCIINCRVVSSVKLVKLYVYIFFEKKIEW